MKKYYIVWNEAKTQGIIVDEKQLAYEARKGSDTNCYDSNGNKSLIAVAFTDQTVDDNCTIQEIVIDCGNPFISPVQPTGKLLTVLEKLDIDQEWSYVNAIQYCQVINYDVSKLLKSEIISLLRQAKTYHNI